MTAPDVGVTALIAEAREAAHHNAQLCDYCWRENGRCGDAIVADRFRRLADALEAAQRDTARLERREHNLVGLLTYIRMEVARETGVPQNEPSDVVDTVRHLLADAELHRAKVARLREALVRCALPYEALLMDTPSRKWIAPAVWQAMEQAVVSARAAIAQEGAR